MKPYFHLCLLAVSLCAFLSCQKTDLTHNASLSAKPSSHGLFSKSNLGFTDDYSVSTKEAEAFAVFHKQNSVLESIVPFCIHEDTLLYICNFDDRWMIISGDKRIAPILAQGREEPFDIEALPSGLHLWLKSMADDIRVLRYYSDEKDNDYTQFWSSLNPKKNDPKLVTKSEEDCKWYAVETFEYTGSTEQTIIPHLIQTKWGQGYPWNQKTPYDISLIHPKRCLLGCTATATGQLLYYTHFNLYKPNRLYHDISCTASYVNGNTYNINRIIYYGFH